MTIQEILTAHTQSFDWYPCKCGWKPVFDGQSKAVDQHRAHLAEVLDKHMQEREAEAWELGASTAWQRSSPTVNGTNYYWRSKGEPVNPHKKETPNGR